MGLFKKILAALMFSAIAITSAQAACTDPAGPNVNWSGCNKNGIRVPGANLSGANLSNALFGPTAKYTADFSRANLQGANFTGSNVPTSVNFAGADLSGATWVDGLVCAAGSIGKCSNRAKAPTAAMVCPSGASAATGSNTCEAVAGYFKDTAGAFNVCTAGSFCVAGSVAPKACQTGSSSVAGGKASSDCNIVLAGYFKDSTGTLSACTAGSFCAGGNAGPTPCPAGTYSASIGATGDKTCIPTTAGNYAVAGSAAQQTCPTGTSSGVGAKATSDCNILLAGYFKDAVGMISVCPAGSFCTAGSVTPQPCPSGSNSAAGAKAATDCSLAVAGPKNSSDVSRLTCTVNAGLDYTSAKRHLEDNCSNPIRTLNCSICFSNTCGKEIAPTKVVYSSNLKLEFSARCKDPIHAEQNCPFKWCVIR